MKDFLPLLIGIIWLGFKLYQNNQKKSLKASPPGQPDDEYGQETGSKPEREEKVQASLEEFMESFFGGKLPEGFTDDNTVEKTTEQFESVENAYYDAEKIEEKEKPIDYWDSNIDVEAESIENKSIHDAEVPVFSQDFSVQSQSSENQIDIEEFDLRKAVIYDAVLNRPYS